jgi:hypothetical protein
MSCDRHSEIDLAGYVTDPQAAEFAAFREHVSGCETCAPIVAEWLALRNELVALDPQPHPSPEALAAFADGGANAATERHLAGCTACRSELRVIREFEAPAFETAPVAVGPSWLERLRDSLDTWLPAPALAAAALLLLALPLGWFAWRAIPGETDAVTVAAPDSTPAASESEEFAAARPGEPEIRVAAVASADEIPDDDPSFDAERPFEVGINDTGFPGFSEQELEGMPEPSLALEPMELADPLESGIEIADAAQAEGAASGAEPERAPIQIAALLPSELPRYVPSASLAGGSLASLRLDSAVRGAQGSLPHIQAMAPDHVAAVEGATPTLYWSLSGTSDVPVEVTLVARESGDTLLERRFAPPLRRGLHALALSRAGARLPQGVIVEWRELDVVSNAALRFVPPAVPFEAEPGREAHARAAAGYWIDAFAQLSRWIEAEPEAEALRLQRAALATQVGLEAP